MKRLVIPLLSLLTLCLSAHAQPLANGVAAALQSAINSPARPEDDRKRDADRLPLDTMTFFGLREDMTVLDIDPGAGYYTRLLAPVLKEKGQFYLAVGTDYVASSLLKEPGL
jgi:predicted methyltransferase